MTTPRKLAGRASWSPKVALTHAVREVASDTALATNGNLSSILPAEDRETLQEINLRLTGLAIEQCAAGGGAANQIDFGSLACVTLAELAAHGVFPDDLLSLSADHDVVFPWSLQYGNARTPFNLRLVRVPLAVCFPRTVADVAFWVNWVRDHRLSVSIRSGGNSYEGLSSMNQVVIDLTCLTLQDDADAEVRIDAQFRIDAEEEVVHVAPGVRLGVLYTELARKGFALAGGQCAPVCVGGLVGTGGIGFATREFGWAADQLLEVECVLADGSVVVANADNEDADLYRACKGAGAAGLCVMTRLSLQLVPAVPVLFYRVTFNVVADDGLSHGAEVLAAWQNLAANAPDAFSSMIFASAATDGSSLLTVNGEFRVEDEECEIEDAKDVLRDILQTHWLDHLSASAQPDEVEIERMSTAEAATTAATLVPMPYLCHWKLKSKFTFRSLTADELAPTFEYLRTTAPSHAATRAIGYFNSWLCGGASNRMDAEGAVVPAREGTVMWVHSGAQWRDPSLEDDALAWVEGLWELLDAAVDSWTGLYGCPELELGSQLDTPPDLRYLRAYWSSPGHDFVPFLVGVKNRYDPGDVFRFAQSIPLEVEGA